MEQVVDSVRPALQAAQDMYRDNKDKIVERLETVTERGVGVAQKVASGASRALVRVSVILAISWILLTIAVAFYAVFRYLYLPTSSHVAQVHLNFNTSSHEPFADVMLAPNNSWLLRAGQPYDVSVALEVPESEVNKDLGVVMVELRLYTAGSNARRWTSRRHTMVRYKSLLHQVLQTLFWSPLLVTDFRDESQMLYVFMFEDFVDNSAHPVTRATITMDKPLQLYSAHLRFDAHFTGLRHYMYWYPISTAAVIICFIFLGEAMVAMMLGALVLYCVYASKVDEGTNSDLDSLGEDEEDGGGSESASETETVSASATATPAPVPIAPAGTPSQANVSAEGLRQR